MKKTLVAFTLLAAVGGLLTGCETTPIDTGAYLPVNTTVNDVENHEGLVLLDRRVQTSVTCPGIQERRLDDGRLQVTANLRNRESRRIQVQVNCVFKDDQGFPTEGEETPFKTVILSENAQEPVQFIALNDKAHRYTIRVREAH
jgi:uncharacterized protein (DUF2141 family)